MNKKKFNHIILQLMLGIFALGVFQQTVFADEMDEAIKQAGYTYKIKHPENQMGGNGALNLRMTPGQVQTVTVEIKNLSERELNLRTNLSGARTNGNGGLEYTKNDFKADKSMKYDLPDLIKVPEKMTLEPNGSAEMQLDIKMPEVAFDGIVTGGVELQEITETEETAEPGSMIVNEIAYLFGVTLSMTDNEVKPEFDLKKVYPQLANYRNAIFIDLANQSAMKIEDLILDIQVTEKGKDAVLYESKKTNTMMAPNTIMSYPVVMEGERMVPGDFTAHVVANFGGKEWKWDEDFTITDEDASKFNEQAVDLLQERGLDFKLIAMIVGGVLIVVGGIYAVLQLTKRKKKNEKSKSRSKRKKR